MAADAASPLVALSDALAVMFGNVLSTMIAGWGKRDSTSVCSAEFDGVAIDSVLGVRVTLGVRGTEGQGWASSRSAARRIGRSLGR